MRRVGYQSVQVTIEYATPSYEKGGARYRDDIFDSWLAQAFVFLKPHFLKMRSSPNYADLLKQLPEFVIRNAKDRKPEELLRDEAEYDNFMERFAQVRLEDPNCHAVFRMVVGSKPA